MFSKKKTECRVCGYRFTPERENIYTAEEPRSMAPRIDFPAIVERHDADAEETEGGEDED